MLGWFTGLGLWIRIAIVVGILAVIAAAVWYVHHSIWKDGYRAAEAKLVPQITKLENDLKNARSDLDLALAANAAFKKANVELADKVAAQNVSIAAFEHAALEAQTKARAAIAQVIRTNAENTKVRAELKRLQDIINGPPMTEGDCEQADLILRNLLRDSVPVSAGTPAPRN